MQRLARAAVQHEEQEQDHRPEAEYDFDLPEEVPQARMRRVDVRQTLEIVGAERMNEGDGQQRGSCDFDDAWRDRRGHP